MSIKQTVEIQCPRCGCKSKTDIWSDISAYNTKLKKQLLKGKINLFYCRSCGLKDFVPVDFLYEDIQNDICVRYIPLHKTTDMAFLNRFIDDAMKDLELYLQGEKLSDYFRNFHVVFSMDELVRYIVFRDRIAQREVDILISRLLF